jgi:hypothetical protein
MLSRLERQLLAARSSHSAPHREQAIVSHPNRREAGLLSVDGLNVKSPREGKLDSVGVKIIGAESDVASGMVDATNALMISLAGCGSIAIPAGGPRSLLDSSF